MPEFLFIVTPHDVLDLVMLLLFWGFCVLVTAASAVAFAAKCWKRRAARKAAR
jgi:hypothetical protein